MKYTVRLCAAVLALAAFGSILASCGSSEPADTKTTEAATGDAATVTEEITTDYMPELPTAEMSLSS